LRFLAAIRTAACGLKHRIAAPRCGPAFGFGLVRHGTSDPDLRQTLPQQTPIPRESNPNKGKARLEDGEPLSKPWWRGRRKESEAANAPSSSLLTSAPTERKGSFESASKEWKMVPSQSPPRPEDAKTADSGQLTEPFGDFDVHSIQRLLPVAHSGAARGDMVLAQALIIPQATEGLWRNKARTPQTMSLLSAGRSPGPP
jgi:hypothetical protein